MICGVDEAGRGPVVGPMVVAAVCVESDAPLRQLNVRDSKKLSPERRAGLAPGIPKLLRAGGLDVAAGGVAAERSGDRLSDCEALLFADVIGTRKPEVAYVDPADVNEYDFRRASAHHLTFDLGIVSKHETDDLLPVVSAASILAKLTRDAEMRRIEAERGAKIG